jgi:hypothetical protein
LGVSKLNIINSLKNDTAVQFTRDMKKKQSEELKLYEKAGRGEKTKGWGGGSGWTVGFTKTTSFTSKFGRNRTCLTILFPCLRSDVKRHVKGHMKKHLEDYQIKVLSFSNSADFSVFAQLCVYRQATFCRGGGCFKKNILHTYMFNYFEIIFGGKGHRVSEKF